MVINSAYEVLIWTYTPFGIAIRRAYRDWQYRYAVGANRRLFSDRSMVQHCAMFDRFYRYLIEHRAAVTTFTQADLMAFLDTISEQSTSGADLGATNEQS